MTGKGNHVLACCAVPRKCAVYGPAGRLKSSVRKKDNKRKIVIVIVIIQASRSSFYHLRATKTAPRAETKRARAPDIAVCNVDAADILPGLVAPWIFCMPECPFDVASMLGSM